MYKCTLYTFFSLGLRPTLYEFLHFSLRLRLNLKPYISLNIEDIEKRPSVTVISTSKYVFLVNLRKYILYALPSPYFSKIDKHAASTQLLYLEVTVHFII